MAKEDSIETVAPPNVRTGCICFNQGRPDANGWQLIDPCCRVHYAERMIFTLPMDTETEIEEEELAEWRHREHKRVSYPKMTVARP